jgi:hypothetical protein
VWFVGFTVTEGTVFTVRVAPVDGDEVPVPFVAVAW